MIITLFTVYFITIIITYVVFQYFPWFNVFSQP